MSDPLSVRYLTDGEGFESSAPISEPVLLGEILIEAGQDTQDTPEIGRLDHVLCCFAALLEVPGQAPVAVRERAERGLDPPPDRQGREAAGGGVAERDLDVDGVPVGRGPDHRLTGVGIRRSSRSLAVD